MECIPYNYYIIIIIITNMSTNQTTILQLEKSSNLIDLYGTTEKMEIVNPTHVCLEISLTSWLKQSYAFYYQ